MRILGIDPGVATTGWAVVDFDKEEKIVDFGVVSTSKEHTQPERLSEIYEDIVKIIKDFSPDYGAVELLLFNNNAKTAMAVGESRGVVILALTQNKIPFLQFTPPQIKLSISGNGRADKKQVQENVKRIFKLEQLPKPDDAADAVAIALCCRDSLKLDSRINKKQI